jgi:hypothetical protein
VSNIAQAEMLFRDRTAIRPKKRGDPKEETLVDSFLHEKNLGLLRRQLAESDPTKNPQRHKMLLRLLAEEEAKEKK